ncbi:MAG: hypothetical protein IBX36_03700 [Dehalococcoidia bacterium]|nr:hypothetical protein [Dehalococcoidia bacterium]
MMEKVRERVKRISASVALGIGLLTLGVCLIVVSLFFHVSIFALVLTWILFSSAGAGGWLIGRGTRG